ncbi:hypothetical protein E2C01_010834 [Portunus trituberculatus]|uniref:Secreted protein n=1 Tax=Portunus trituberculatus TaxID=210409 RepID=A0A5B7D9H1_PORTR|nr:hypothetical protein [Portunus trituberculatus]
METTFTWLELTRGTWLLLLVTPVGERTLFQSAQVVTVPLPTSDRPAHARHHEYLHDEGCDDADAHSDDDSAPPRDEVELQDCEGNIVLRVDR